VSLVLGTFSRGLIDSRDSFSGVLLAQLAAGNPIHKAVDIAQKAAIMTLASPHAVSDKIRDLKLSR
jgi:sugar/nucleoside kinase (ribokinase family)